VVKSALGYACGVADVINRNIIKIGFLHDFSHGHGDFFSAFLLLFGYSHLRPPLFCITCIFFIKKIVNNYARHMETKGIE
jgi:hypothetical protein